jgi:hypothetical protein
MTTVIAWRRWCFAKLLSKRASVLRFFDQTPKWVDVLMRMRNSLMGLFGFEAAQSRDIDFREGGKFGFFDIYEVSVQQVVLGKKDRHLNFHLTFRLASGVKQSESTDTYPRGRSGASVQTQAHQQH